MKTATFSLKNKNHDFNIERFKTRLTAKCCVIFVVVIQIIIRLIIFLILKDELPQSSEIAYIISLPLLVMTALVVCFEYFLFKRIGPRVMNYSRIIDLILLVLFTAEWITTLIISLSGLSVTNPPSLPLSSIFTFAGFGWRTLFLLFLIQGWKWLIVPPTLTLSFTIGFVLHYVPKSSWWYLLLVGIPTVIYTILILYFMDKIKWKEVFTNTQQERWMQINQFVLNNIPENIVILDVAGQVSFVSEYCKAFMESSRLNGSTSELFTKIRGVTQQPETNPISRQGERFTTTHCMLEPTTGHTLPNSPKIYSLEDLIENFKIIIQDSQLQEKEFLIYNGNLIVEAQQTKSIEIKVSYVQQYARKYIILIIRDTTQRDLLVTLQDNNKYKDQLLASVSHELRTPLNGNINLVESALQDKNVPKNVREGLLTPALRSSQFLLHLINDILDLSQIKAQKLRLIYKSDKLQETLKNTLQLVELQAKKKGVELSMNIHPDIMKMSLCTDHVRLSQIVLNLLNNAIKFTQKGTVILTAIPTEDLSCVKISVQDSGLGMTEENVKKLFSEFTHIEFAERKEINPTGVGLGLSIAESLAKLLGPNGSQQQEGITVESVLNEGSTFSFLIENKEEKLDPKDLRMTKWRSSSSFSDKGEGIIDEFEELEPKAIPQTFHMKSMMMNVNNKKSLPPNCDCSKILIVDDNPFNTMAFEAVLRSLHFKCDSVFDGKTAIEKVLERQKTRCGENCKPYSVIFMDQEMPGITGSETVEEIRRLQVQELVPEMKIIGCTAHGSAEEIENFMKSGIDFCIQKPIKAHEVQKILKDVC